VTTTSPTGSGYTVSEPAQDVLGPGFHAVTITLPDAADGPSRATLVQRPASAPTDRAVLYVHGYADYFFQADLADFFARNGQNFYGIDLHRYGRSILPHQTPYDMAQVEEYQVELDAAVDLITRAGHTSITVVAHSTGGLIVALWLADRRSVVPVDAVVLNSPFLDINAGVLAKTLIGRGVDLTSRFRPHGIVPVPDPGHYVRSIYQGSDGEWDFDLQWKPLKGVPVRVGWLAAIRKAHRRLRRNLGIEVPILVMCSTNTVREKEWGDAFANGDAVLDADKIADFSTRLGRDVTCIRIPNALHDIFLSRGPVRDVAYRTMADWLTAHGKGEFSSH
jgi:alpha-beta hydrolase superfamily lysophospholipase